MIHLLARNWILISILLTVVLTTSVLSFTRLRSWLFKPNRKYDKKRKAYYPAFVRAAAVMGLYFATILCSGFAITQYDLTTQVKGILPTANGGTGTSNAATGTAGGVVLSNSPSITTPTLSSPVITGALGSNIDFGTSQSESIEVANAGTTGTTVNKLAKLSGAPSTALIAATTDTGGIVGVVTSGAGTTGNALIAIQGIASCVFDGATTAGDYVSISSSVAGDCHDSGSTYPTSGQVLGRVGSTNGAGGTFSVLLFGYEIKGAQTTTINFADQEVPSGTINGSNAAFTLAHTPTTSSLQLYKNGQQMVPGASADYTISTSTVTFNSGAIPKTGDVLVAFYRF